MPQDVKFVLPFPLRISTDLDRARDHNLQWVQGLGLVAGEESLAWFSMWDMPKLAALGFPYATGEGLDLCADAMAFFFVFDDQFDGPLGHHPDWVADICQGFIDIVHGARPGGSAGPLLRAFADVWDRCQKGASARWRARVAGEWEYYFAAHAHESINRNRGTPAGMREYLQVRRGVAATDLPISLGERAAMIDIPPAVFHSPQLRIMRQTAIDITLMCNDVYSLEKEEVRGDMDNLILVIEHEQNLPRAKAVAHAQHKIAQRCSRFQRLSDQIPDVYAQLELTAQQRAVVDRYVEVMATWIRGYHEWETQTLRYAQAVAVLPATAPGYFEELLA
jgi:pentalenene synthase/avermitilol synthase